jgi:integrase
MAVYKRHGHYYTDFYVHGKRIRKKIPTRRKDIAEQYAADLQVKYVKGLMGVWDSDARLDELVERYLEFSKTNNSPLTYERDKLTLRTFMERVGVARVMDLTPKLVEEYKTVRRASVSARTVNLELTTVNAMLNRAVEWGIIPHNPLGKVRRIKAPAGKPIRFLTKEEVALLLKNCTKTLYPIVYTFLKTGMRRNELVHLEWSDVDFNTRQIRIVNKEHRRFHPKGQKERFIPIEEGLYELLSDLRKKSRGPYVFPTKNGTPRANNLLKELKRTGKKCGIGDLNIHTLRHTFASHLVMGGVDLPTVQKLLGHSDIKTTMIYAHLAPDHLRGAVEKLGY